MATATTFANVDPVLLGAYMSDYSMRGQHSGDRAMTRGRYDVAQMVENNEISTGPGRWVLGVPNAYGNAAFVPTPTTINQRWGASHIVSQMKTDTESDLWNLGRPSTRTTCGQYQPEHGAAAAASLVPMPEVAFPQTSTHYVDPPSNLRGTGINRWEWLCENPQQDVAIPFEYGINTQVAIRDSYRAALTAGPLVTTEPVRERTMICRSNQLFMEPAVPVPRTRRPGEPASFNNAVPGASQKEAMPVPASATTSNQNWSSVSDGMRGVLAPPPLFGQFIAPH